MFQSNASASPDSISTLLTICYTEAVYNSVTGISTVVAVARIGDQAVLRVVLIYSFPKAYTHQGVELRALAPE